MKKTAIALAVMFAGLATTAQAAPQDNSWYVGGKLGWSNYSGTQIYDFADEPKMGHRDQVGGGAFVGFQHNQYLGFEIGYDWLGRMNNLPAHLNPTQGKYSAHGAQLSAKLSYPVLQDLDLYSRLGAMVWRANADFSTANISDKNHQYGVSPLLAAGLEYAFNSQWASRLEYQWVNNIGDKNHLGMRPDNGLLSLGVSYRFGNEAPQVVPPAPEPTPAPVAETKRFELKSDVLFDFNKSTLKAQGHTALNDLYSKLSALDPKEGSVVVLGYTDRIGSDQYNLRLSEERARTVVGYLVSKGIPAERITAQGKGKADPVTGNTCDAIRNKPQLVNCLAPDRRVVIEVSGIHETAQ